MSEFCPISFVKVNEKIVRLNSFLTILCVLVFMFTPAKWIMCYLVVDFALRAANKGKYSPIAFVSKTIAGLLKLEPVMIDAKPKNFSAGIGMVFCIIISAFQCFNLGLYALVLAVMLLACASLEFLIGYCVGCKIYYFVNKIKIYFGK